MKGTDSETVAVRFLSRKWAMESFRVAIREAEFTFSLLEEETGEVEYDFAQLLSEQGTFINKDGTFEHYIDEDGLERVKFTPATP